VSAAPADAGIGPDRSDRVLQSVVVHAPPSRCSTTRWSCPICSDAPHVGLSLCVDTAITRLTSDLYERSTSKRYVRVVPATDSETARPSTIAEASATTSPAGRSAQLQAHAFPAVAHDAPSVVATSPMISAILHSPLMIRP
jgi:hypothetical protein